MKQQSIPDGFEADIALALADTERERIERDRSWVLAGNPVDRLATLGRVLQLTRDEPQDKLRKTVAREYLAAQKRYADAAHLEAEKAAVEDVLVGLYWARDQDLSGREPPEEGLPQQTGPGRSTYEIGSLESIPDSLTPDSEGAPSYSARPPP